MHIAIVVFDGFDNLDAIGPFEVFNHARTFGADIEVGLYTLSPQEVVTSSHGLRIQPDGVLKGESGETRSQTAGSDGENPDVPDIVIVPGGSWLDHAAEGIRAQVQQGDLADALVEMHDNGAAIASVCTGGMVLASAGLTDGRPAVTHHEALDDLRELGAEVVEARIVDDGNLLTAGGITAGIDLALHLVEREIGRDVAARVEALMEHEPHGDVYTG